MSQEIFEIVQEMDMKDIELQMAMQCAPMLAGLKLSNLLMIKKEDYDKVRKLLKNMHVAYFIVASAGGKMAVLLFDRHQLEAYLQKEEVWYVFRSIGYPKEHLGKVLYKFRKRYEGHLEGGEEFPHEMGLLLGYPVEDVKGFMQDGGENCLYTGYWKVYQNLAEKKALFHKFETARDVLIRMLSEGWSMAEIVQKRMLAQMAV